MSGTFAIKDARMELKTTRAAKDFLSKAAVLDGMDLSSFMIAAAMERARTVMHDHAAITLSAEGQARLASLLLEGASPTAAMEDLRRLPRLKVRE